MLGVTDWTQVFIAAIAAVPATIAAVGTYLLHRQMRTPSGDTIGQVTERTHDLTAADLALTRQVHGVVTTAAEHRAGESRTRSGDTG